MGCQKVALLALSMEMQMVVKLESLKGSLMAGKWACSLVA